MKVNRYRRRLPHILVPGSLYFLTFRLSPTQPLLLSDQERSCLIFHINRMDPGTCEAFVIMPDHIHLLYQSNLKEDLRRTLSALKGSSSHTLSKQFGRTAPIWQEETYDHIIRNEVEKLDTWRYIESNPVRRSLAKDPTQYPWSSAFRQKDGNAAEGGRAPGDPP